MKRLPEHGWCYVCGKDNPQSIGVEWFVNEDQSIYGKVRLSKAQQGPPELAHGGASAALLDEAMGAAVWQAGHIVVAVNLNVSYHHPIPLGEEVEIKGEVVGQEGKAVYTEGEIRLGDGRVAVSAQGTFVEAPKIYAKYRKQIEERYPQVKQEKDQEG